MDKKRLAVDMVDDFEMGEYDDYYSAIRPDLKNFVMNHPLADEAVEEDEFNQIRDTALHPHSRKVLGGVTSVGAILGALAGINAARARGLGTKIVTGGMGAFGGAVAGAVPGGIAKMVMDSRHADKLYGPSRYDAYSEIYDDLEDEAERLVNEKVPVETRMQLSLEKRRIEEQRLADERKARLMGQAIGTAGALGQSYLRQQEQKRAFYVEGIEKLAEEKKNSAGVAVGTGVGAGALNLAGRMIGSAKHTGKTEGAKGVGKQISQGFKSMSEGAGGKGKAIGNLARQHGKGAAVTGAAIGALAYGAGKYKNREKKEATTLGEVLLEKLAGREYKGEEVMSGVERVRSWAKRGAGIAAALGAAGMALPSMAAAKAIGYNRRQIATAGLATGAVGAINAGIGGALLGAGAGAIAGPKYVKEATTLGEVLLEKLAGIRGDKVRSLFSLGKTKVKNIASKMPGPKGTSQADKSVKRQRSKNKASAAEARNDYHLNQYDKSVAAKRKKRNQMIGAGAGVGLLGTGAAAALARKKKKK